MLDLIVWFTIAMSFAVTYYLLEKQGFTQGAWTPFFSVLLLVPAWFERLVPGMGGLGIDPRTACCLAIALVMLMQPMEPGKGYRWLFLDTCLVLLIFSQLISQLANYDLRPMTMPDAMRTVGLPYFIGRIIIRSVYDVFAMSRALCLPVVLVSTYALAESVTHVNPVFEFFDSYTWGLHEAVLERWGLKRAMAFVGHPIYLSLLLSMMLPFLLEVFHQWRTTSTPWWGWLPLCFGLGGVTCTVSRSGQLATMTIFAADLFFRFPRFRPAILSLIALGALAIFIGREEIVAMLEQASGTDSTSMTIVIKGEPVQYNGTRHRDLLHVVYREETEQAGFLGWGYHFLNRIEQDPHIPQQFKSIDDHYLLTQLRYGTFGVWVFLLFTIVASGSLLRVAFDPEHPARTLAGTIFGAFVAIALVVRGVSLQGDIGFPWYFLAGLGGRLYSMKLDAEEIRNSEFGVRNEIQF